MTYDLTGAPPAPPLRGRGVIITGVVLVLLGLLGFVAGIIGITATASTLLGQIGSPQTTPATVTRQFDAGTTYAVYEAVPGAVGGTTGDLGGPLDLQVVASDVTVTGPGGMSVPVVDTGDTVDTVGGNDGEVFGQVATFDPPVSGIYTVAIATTGSQVVVAPAVSSIGRAVSWAAVVGISVVVGLIGVVLLIVGLVLRSSSRKAQVAAAYPAAAAWPPAEAAGTGYPTYPTTDYPTTTDDAPEPAATVPEPVPATAPEPVPEPVPEPAALPPAGWYPDPERPGGQRWWDGTAWSEHRA